MTATILTPPQNRDALERMDAGEQNRLAVHYMGQEVGEEDVTPLLLLAEFGKSPETRMWAIRALSAARPFAGRIVPELSRLRSADNPGTDVTSELRLALDKLQQSE
jgi:hypothetical protein